MTTPGNDTLPADAPVPRARRVSTRLRVALLLAVMACVAVAATFARSYAANVDTAQHLGELLVPIAIPTLISLFALRQEQVWGRPMRRTEVLINQVRRGEAPIQELSDIRGGLEPLIPIVQDILRELREKARDNAEMQAQMRQRVEHRTDALERTIGSLHKQARLDKLTGLFNRRALDDTLPQLLEQCRAEKSSLCAMMIDVDNFKLLNDTLGHEAGDVLLRDIAKILSSGLHANDSAYRLGGDEFVLLLKGLTDKEVAPLAARLTALVDALTRPLRVTRAPRISIGIAFAGPAATQADLLKRADASLYEIKAARKSSRGREVA